MSSINAPKHVQKTYTHGGTRAKDINPKQQLRRSVLSCLLWENEFYESGQEIGTRILEFADRCTKEEVIELAMEARHQHGLRHVPLLLLIALIRKGGVGVKHAIANVIRRPDEMTELLAMYWLQFQKKRGPLDKQLQRGLALAFPKFNEYSLAKYNRDGPVKLRDVLFLSHAKPKNEEQAQLFKRVANNQLVTPNTWEVLISACGNDSKKKKEIWETLLKNTLDPEHKDRDYSLGYLALLRNLRNMVDAGCDSKLVSAAILLRKNADLVFPFRYIAAARAAPRLEGHIDRAFIASFEQKPKLPGKTVLIVDISGSMEARLSAKSDMTRLDSALALAAIIRECSEDPHIYATAGNDGRRVHATALVPPRRGMALCDAIKGMNRELGGGGVFTKQCMDFVENIEKTADRVILFTDEQDTSGDKSADKVIPFGRQNYLVNIASARNGIGYGPWTHIDGFSEAVVRYIMAVEEQAS